MAEFNQSLNFIFGMKPNLPEGETFNPLDNDYIEIAMMWRDSTNSDKPNIFRTDSDYELALCTKDELEKVIEPTIVWAYSNDGLCLKHKERLSFRSNFVQASNRNLYLSLFACDTKKRPTCKSKKEIGKFLAETSFYFVNQNNIVVPDRYTIADDEKSHFRGDYDSYFPLTYGQVVLYQDALSPVKELDGYIRAVNYYFAKNELTIGDDMVFYNKRTTTFMQYESKVPKIYRQEEFFFDNDAEKYLVRFWGFHVSQ